MTESIEQMVLVVLSNGMGVSNEELNRCSRELYSFQQTPDGLDWSIAYLSEEIQAKNNKIMYFAALIIRDWIVNRYEEMVENFNKTGDLIHILFEYLPGYKAEYEQKFQFTLSRCQVKISEHVYPDEWAECMQVAMTFPPKILLMFFMELLSDIKDNVELEAAITMRMSIDGSDTQLLQFVLDNIPNYATECYTILLDMLAWADINAIAEHPMLGTIVETLDNIEGNSIRVNKFLETPLELAMKVIDGIFNSTLDDNVVVDLVGKYSLLERLHNIAESVSIEGGDGVDILSLAATLVCSIGVKMLASGNIGDIPEFALQLFACESDSVSEAILPFIRKLAEPCDSDVIIDAVFRRYAQFFTTGNIELTDFAQDMLKILLNYSRKNRDLTAGLIGSTISAVESSQEGQLAAALFHFTSLIRNPPFLPELTALASSFMGVAAEALAADVPVLSQPGGESGDEESEFIEKREEDETYEVEDPSSLIPYFAFTRSVDFYNRKSQDADKTDAFNLVLSVATVEGMPHQLAQTLAKLMTDLFPKSRSVSAESLLELVHTCVPQYEKIAASFLSKAGGPEVQQEFFHAAAEFFVGLINQQTEESQALRAISICFTFIDNLPYSKNPSYRSDLVELLEVVMQSIDASSPLFSRLVDTLWMALREDCVDLFLQCAQSASTIESQAQVCDTAARLCSTDCHKEWVQELLSAFPESMSELLTNEFDEVTMADVLEISEIWRLTLRLFQNYFRFAEKAIPFVTDLSQPLALCSALMSHLNLPALCEPAFVFLNTIPDSEASSLLAFVQPVLLSPVGSDASSRSMLVRAMKVHARLFALDAGALMSEATAVLPTDAIGAYEEMMAKGNAQIQREVGEFFQKLNEGRSE